MRAELSTDDIKHSLVQSWWIFAFQTSKPRTKGSFIWGSGGPSVFIALYRGLKTESHSLVYFRVAATLGWASSPVADQSWTPQDLRPPHPTQIPHQP